MGTEDGGYTSTESGAEDVFGQIVEFTKNVLSRIESVVTTMKDISTVTSEELSEEVNMFKL